MDIQIETVQQRECKLFAPFCLISALISLFFTCVTVWVTLFFAAAGIALFILDLWYNKKLNGIALFGVILAFIAFIFAIVIIVMKFASPTTLVDFEFWLEKALGLKFKYPLF